MRKCSCTGRAFKCPLVGSRLAVLKHCMAAKLDLGLLKQCMAAILDIGWINPFQSMSCRTLVQPNASLRLSGGRPCAGRHGLLCLTSWVPCHPHRRAGERARAAGARAAAAERVGRVRPPHPVRGRLLAGEALLLVLVRALTCPAAITLSMHGHQQASTWHAAKLVTCAALTAWLLWFHIRWLICKLCRGRVLCSQVVFLRPAGHNARMGNRCNESAFHGYAV